VNSESFSEERYGRESSREEGYGRGRDVEPHRRPEDEEDEREQRRRRPDDADEYDEEDEYDEDRPRPRRPRSRGDEEPHRGAVILVLGILSVCATVLGVCCLPILLGPVGLGLGIPAWVMGQIDRRKIATGRMDPAGGGMTTAGWVCGIIGTALGGVDILCGIVGLILGFSGFFNQGRF
jgi:hypothetical protein